MTVFIKAALIASAVAVGGSALNAKVAKNRANNPQDTVTAKSAGAGSPGGAAIDIEDIVGTEVAGDDITPFAYKAYDEQGMTEEDQIRALLEEEGGVMSAASGKYLSRRRGGGITFELLQSLFGSEKLKELGFDSIDDMIAANNPAIDEIVASSSNAPSVPDPQVTMDMPTPNTEDIRQMTGMEGVVDKVGYFAETNPQVFTALTNVISDAINAKIKGAPKQATNLDSRPMMAGNANRRAAQMNFKPIGAKSGGVLDRKMFTPMLYGGELDGPGGPKEDLIPVMASDGEYMLSKAAVDQAGGGDHNKGIARLEAFNSKGNKNYG